MCRSPVRRARSKRSPRNPGFARRSTPCVCHPHPLFGGTMDNKVVTTLARALHEVGMPRCASIFAAWARARERMTMAIGETADAAAVADHGAQRWPGRDLCLPDFRSAPTWPCACRIERAASRLITVAPPVDRFDFSALAPPALSLARRSGRRDEVVDPQSVIAWVKSLKPQPRLVVLPGVGHFFHGHSRLCARP